MARRCSVSGERRSTREWRGPGGNRSGGGDDCRGRGWADDDCSSEELILKLVHINDVSNVAKGGKRVGFAARLVVGEDKGRFACARSICSAVPAW